MPNETATDLSRVLANPDVTTGFKLTALRLALKQAKASGDREKVMEYKRALNELVAPFAKVKF